MHSFTSMISAHDAALPLAKVTDEDLAKLLQLPLEGARARRAELARQHADEGWVRATLRELPETALVVLSLVADQGGRIGADVLAGLAREQYRMTIEEVQAGVRAAIAHVLLVPLESHWEGPLLSLVAPAAAWVAAQVADLDLAELPRGELVPGEEPGGRALLAACMALRHVDVKLTQAGRPHRSAIRRLAKTVGVTDDLLEELLVAAMAFGLLAIEEDQELLRPDVERLLHAAEGRYPGCAVAEALSAALERGPVSIEELQRWILRSPPSNVAPVSASSVAHLPGFRAGTVGGRGAVARDAGGDRAAGHVTPSFEVFLPPESRFTDIVRIGGCSDLVRIDRMMVWRLTKASVRRAVSAGASVAQILSALAGASRTAVPQNVEAAIRDWEGGAVTAALAEGRVIAVDPAVADRVRVALASLDPRELVPGVFVVEGDTPPEAIRARLRRADVASRVRLMPVDLEAPVSEARLGMGSPELRARVAAWWTQRQRARPDAARPRGAAAARATVVPRGAATVSETADPSEERATLAAVAALARQLGPSTNLASFEIAARTVLRDLSKAQGPSARSFEAQLEKLVTRIASGELDEARFAAMLRQASGPPPVPPLAWVREKIGRRLQMIVPEVPLALDLGGPLKQIRFSRLLQRGDTQLVLGEELDTGEAVAVPLPQITGFAVLGGTAPAGAPSPVPRLSGHVRCPCGSGARYRDCCRP
jgi:hypothetical protein